MIRHIVMFRLIATDEAQKDADVVGVRSRLEALVGVIPGLQSIVFERDLGLVANHLDAVLVSEHDDNDALETYQAHEAHRAAAEFIGTVTGPDRAVVDYTV
jgi:hypothetical protein